MDKAYQIGIKDFIPLVGPVIYQHKVLDAVRANPEGMDFKTTLNTALDYAALWALNITVAAAGLEALILHNLN